MLDESHNFGRNREKRTVPETLVHNWYTQRILLTTNDLTQNAITLGFSLNTREGRLL